MTQRTGEGSHGHSGAARDSSSSLDPFRFDDLVGSFIDEATYGDAAPELRDFHARRRRVLAGLFRCDFDPEHSGTLGGIPDDTDERAAMDQEITATIARSCLEEVAGLASPFGVRLAGERGPIELGLIARHSAGIDDAIATLRVRVRETFADCLRSLYPGIEDRTVAESELAARAIRPEDAPDPNDFW